VLAEWVLTQPPAAAGVYGCWALTQPGQPPEAAEALRKAGVAPALLRTYWVRANPRAWPPACAACTPPSAALAGLQTELLWGHLGASSLQFLASELS
jgi:hypothetical protein